MSDPNLRPATVDDIEAVTAVFHRGWHEVHPGRVPDGLTERRTVEAFRDRVTQRITETDETTVAEAEQVYVDSRFRGTSVASLLLTEAERQIAASGHDVAFLVVVRGNDRAQAFYARQGWTDEGDYDYPVQALGEDFVSPCRKFTKRVR